MDKKMRKFQVDLTETVRMGANSLSLYLPHAKASTRIIH
jgi:hypothetical protein